MRKGILFLSVLMIFGMTCQNDLHVKAENSQYESVVEDDTLVVQIQKYYEQRLGFSEVENINSERNLFVSADVEKENQLRKAGFEAMQKRIGAEFVEIRCETDTYNMFYVDHGILELKVYERTIVSYQYPGNPAVDTFSFGTDHTLQLLQSEDAYVIIHDFYDESMLLGVSTLLPDECNMEELDVVELEVLKSESINAAATSYSGYSASKAIAYADQYALIINDAYGKEPNDCANFVSQCLHEGGVAMINSGDYDYGWYHYKNGKSGSLPWVRVSSFVEFWKNQGVSYISANGLTLLPGNPFLYLTSGGSTSGHLMICVGYDSGGVPVFDAHNDDLFREPYTGMAENHTLYTFQFIVKCKTHTNIIRRDAVNHWYQCSICGYESTHTKHTIISAGKCSVCGYVPSIIE